MQRDHERAPSARDRAILIGAPLELSGAGYQGVFQIPLVPSPAEGPGSQGARRALYAEHSANRANRLTGSILERCCGSPPRYDEASNRSSRFVIVHH